MIPKDCKPKQWWRLVSVECFMRWIDGTDDFMDMLVYAEKRAGIVNSADRRKAIRKYMETHEKKI